MYSTWSSIKVGSSRRGPLEKVNVRSEATAKIFARKAAEPDPLRLQKARRRFQGICQNAHPGPSDVPPLSAVIILFIDIKTL